MKSNTKNRGFSLVEVVLALGIFVFAGFAMVGLLGVGLKSGSDSKEQLQAASIAELICSTRRAAPITDFTGASSPQPNFPLPTLATSSSNISATPSPIYLTWDGVKTTSTSGNARFGLLYNIAAPTNYEPVATAGVAPAAGAATVYLYIYWPALAPPFAATTSHFELTTTFALP